MAKHKNHMDGMGLASVGGAEEFDFIPATPWDYSDALGFEAEGLPTRPNDPIFNEAANSDEVFIPEVTSEDYDGIERTVYLLVRDRVRLACNVNTMWRDRGKAAEWIFCSHTPDPDGLTFRLACQALGARVPVLQARLQYQLYRAGVPYPESLSSLADGLPETIASEILYHAGEDGLDVARQAWRWPGIRADIMREKTSFFSEDKFQKVVSTLELSGHLGLKHGFWFLISRNPDLLAREGRRCFSWAKSFYGDY